MVVIRNFHRDDLVAYVHLVSEIDEAAGLLSDAEVEQIVPATRLLALELGIRFLVDHLAGDRRFPATRPSENLARCRTQLDLVRDMEANADEMAEIVRRGGARFRRSRRRDWTTTDALRFRIDGGRART